jgi:hypothetical protein
MPCLNNNNIVIFPVPSCSRPAIDVAVIDISVNAIRMISDISAHFVILDNIEIDSTVFHSIFYDSSGNFALNPAYARDDDVRPYVGINFPYRTINDGNFFSLLDIIFDNIEFDLNISRLAFTPCTNIALTKQLIGLKTFYDLGLLRLECSLDWKSIIYAVNGEIEDIRNLPPFVIVDLIISIVFTSPTVGVLPTIIKLIYSTKFPIHTINGSPTAV